MTTIANNLHYSSTHEWVRQEKDGTLTVGITDHAQCLLGDVVFVELPRVNEQVESGKEAAVLESVKAAADVYCPISGEIIAINTQLAEQPDLINQSPYEKGWIFQIKPHHSDEYKKMMDATHYEKHISK